MDEKVRRLRPLLALCALALLGSAVAARGEEIAGTVTNRTMGAPAAGVVVTLIQHGATDAVQHRDTTDALGRFSLSLDAAPAGNVPLLLSARYQDVDYPARVDAGKPADISVFDLTASDTSLSLVSHHVVLDAAARQGHQIYIFENRGNRTFRTGEGHGHGVEVPLPDGVTQFSGEIEGLHAHGNILVDPRPVPPGPFQLMYTFSLAPDGRFGQGVAHPTKALDILVSPAETGVEADGLEDLGHVDVGGRHFRRLTARDLSPGARVGLRLSGLGGAGDGATGDAGLDGALSGDRLPLALGGAAVLLGLLSLVWRPAWRRSPAAAVPGRLGPDLRRAALLEQIADLDDRLDDGRIDAKDHDTRREALKAEVVHLTRTLDTTAPPAPPRKKNKG